ncbi:MAG: 50S ribosomal protein L17 [Amoebophilaceae bacterium]|jgi:large subunit ribosomal protein L17|nr:50S ribosomal protein L17 [Amoebophilaceae bacterium]
MRHGKKFNHLSRPAAHRKALLANLAKSLIMYKRINTTLAKAKALRRFVEPILTKAKSDTTHARRVVFSYFQDKVPVKELFDNIASKVADRPGGYTRIIRLGNRLSDNAEMCMIELVDYNELLQKRVKPEQSKTRRSKAKVAAAKEVPQALPHEKVDPVFTSRVNTQDDEHKETLPPVEEATQLEAKD